MLQPDGFSRVCLDKKKPQKALHNEKKLLQGIAACEYCCHDNSSGYDFKCRCIRAGVHLLCVHCLLTRMDAQFCFCATKMCVCAVHSQTSRDCDCIFHTAGYPGEQPFCFALLPRREKKWKYTSGHEVARKQIELKGQSPAPLT